MISLAPAIVEFYLSCAAITGLLILRNAIVARDRWAPLNRRFLFGLGVMLVLFAGRALFGLTGMAFFRFVTLAAAAFVPLTAIILAEGLLRRHAAPWIKTFAGAGTIVLLLLAFWPSGSVDPARLYLLMGVQVVGLSIAGSMILMRDSNTLSDAENRMAERIGLVVPVLVPLVAADYLLTYLNLPVQMSALGVLILCWLALSTGREQGGHGALLWQLILILGASGIVAGLIILLAQMASDASAMTLAMLIATGMVAAIYTKSQALRVEGHSLAILRHMAQQKEQDPVDFVRAISRQFLADGTALIHADTIAECQSDILETLFQLYPVLRRSDPMPLPPDHADHVAYLFDRFDATHILRVKSAPLTLVAISMPAFAISQRVELELDAVQRMAALMDANSTAG